MLESFLDEFCDAYHPAEGRCLEVYLMTETAGAGAVGGVGSGEACRVNALNRVRSGN